MLYGQNLPENDITYKNLYITYNFNGKRTYNEKEIIDNLNNHHNREDNSINIDRVDNFHPIIKFNDGITQLKSLFYSQKEILSILVEDYKNYIKDMDKNNLRSKIILDACLNIFIFMRNSKEFLNNSEITKTVKKIFYVFLGRIQIFQKNIVNN